MSESQLPLEVIEEYRATRATIFPSLESLRWFLRTHRDELVDAGALLRPGRQFFIQPERFDRVVTEIGQRRAKRL